LTFNQTTKLTGDGETDPYVTKALQRGEGMQGESSGTSCQAIEGENYKALLRYLYARDNFAY